MKEQMISRYKILGRLGAGGMGEVFRALDTKMQREVALKLLLPQSAQDPERMQRFKHEALTTSALNHPNITTVYEIDEADGKSFISLEFIDGQSLRELVRKGKPDLRQTLDIGAQIADGLHAAHEAGVVHRDLKPENIMVRPDGIAKILDFGLAKLASSMETISPDDETKTMQSPGATLTQPGVVLGTVAYMSPEQARGQELDRRSDLFTFGGILLELLTGKQPFHAASSIETMHAIIHEPPRPLQEVGAPAELLRILRKCLAKRPDERYQSAKDLAIDLRTLQRDIDSGATTGVQAAVSGAVPPSPARRSRAWIAAVAVGAVAVAVVLAFLMGRRPQPPATAPAAVLEMRKLTNTGKASEPLFHPDGQYIAYVSTEDNQRAIRIRQVSTGSEVEVVPAQKDIGVGNLAFTPDGSWLLYTSRPRTAVVRTLWQVSPLGGAPRQVLSDVDGAPSFTPDGTQFLFQRAVSVRELNFYMAPFGSSGEPTQVHEAPPEAVAVAYPVLSPDGREILYMQVDRGDVLHPKLMIKELDSGNVRPVKGPRWMQIVGYDWGRDGKSLYVAGSRSWVERNHVWHVDLESGGARPITQGFDEHAHMTVRADGKALATVRTTIVSQLWHVPMDGTAAENGARARQITRGTDMVGAPKVAPDGRVAYVAEASGDMDLWIMDAEGGNQRQITFGEAQDFWHVWSPDGTRLAFASEREGELQVWVADADGQNARQVTQRGSMNYGPTWSPDGQWLAYIESHGDSSFLSKIAVDGGEPVRLSREQQVMFSTHWSPDGETIAAWAQPSAPSAEIPIALFPADGEGEVRQIPFPYRSRWNVMSLNWMPDGSALCISQRGDDGWQVQTQPLDGGEPQVLAFFPGEELLFNFGWSPDGSFIVAQRGTVNSDILLLENLP